MSEVRELIEALVAKGVDAIDAAEIVIRAVMLGAQQSRPVRTARQERNARYYAKASEKRLKASYSDTPDKETPPTPPKEINPTPPSPPKGGSSPAGFDEFWSRYPNKVGKPAASKAFGRAVRRSPLSEIMAGLERYAAKTDDRPWCNPATWLNQDRWADEPAASTAAAAPPPSLIESDEVWSKRLAAGRSKRMWATVAWGPMPGQAGCRVPARLLADGDGRGWIEWQERAA